MRPRIPFKLNSSLLQGELKLLFKVHVMLMMKLLPKIANGARGSDLKKSRI